MSENGPRGRPSVLYAHPPCPGCGGPVDRRYGESPSSYRSRRCCSLSCGSKVGAVRAIAEAQERWDEAIAAHAPCVVCGGLVTRVRSKEPLVRFIERATCGPACYRQHQKAMAGAFPGTGQIEAGYRRGQLVEVDYAGGFGRQTVRVGPALGTLRRLDQGRWL